MHTYSGRAVFPAGSEYHEDGQHPTLDDIAIGLSRTMRFSGQTPHAYSVLAHTLVVARLVASEEDTKKWTVYALLHDAHEALIGDTPRPWKHQATSDDEDHIDVLMRRALDLPETLHPDAKAAIARADEATLWAEAHALGHRKAQEIWPREEFTDWANAALQMTVDNVASGMTLELFQNQQMARQVFIQNVQQMMPGQEAASMLSVPNGQAPRGKRARA